MKSLYPTLLVLFLLLPYPVLAQPEVFVKNRPYSGEIRVVRGQAYTRAEELLKALGLHWRVEGQLVRLSVDEGSDGSLDGAEKMSFQGRMVPVAIYRMTGEAYLELAPFVRALGGTAVFNKDLNTLDLAPPATQVRRSGGVVSDGRGSDRLKLQKLSYRTTQAPKGEGPLDQLHCYVELLNESPSRSVKGLELKLRWMDGEQELGRYLLELPDLPPGGSHLQQLPLFRFQRGREVVPVVEFVYQP